MTGIESNIELNPNMDLNEKNPKFKTFNHLYHSFSVFRI